MYDTTMAALKREPPYNESSQKVALSMIALNLACLCDELKLLREDLSRNNCAYNGRM